MASVFYGHISSLLKITTVLVIWLGLGLITSLCVGAKVQYVTEK